MYVPREELQALRNLIRERKNSGVRSERTVASPVMSAPIQEKARSVSSHEVLRQGRDYRSPSPPKPSSSSGAERGGRRRPRGGESVRIDSANVDPPGRVGRQHDEAIDTSTRQQVGAFSSDYLREIALTGVDEHMSMVGFRFLPWRPGHRARAPLALLYIERNPFTL